MHQLGDHVQYYDPNYRPISCDPIVITNVHSNGRLELKDALGNFYSDQDPNDWILSWRPTIVPVVSSPPQVIKQKVKYCIYVDPFYLPRNAPKIPDSGKVPTSKIRSWVCINFTKWPKCNIHDKSIDLKYAQGESHELGRYIEGYFYCNDCNIQRKKDERWKELLFI